MVVYVFVTGDRILTPWLTVMGKGLDGMPLIEVQLRRAGDELTGVRAWVSESTVYSQAAMHNSQVQAEVHKAYAAHC